MLSTPSRKLNTKLRTWERESAAQVRECAEAIELADEDILDVMRNGNRKCWTCSMSPRPSDVWLA